jgi:hypothetical protein
MAEACAGQLLNQLLDLFACNGVGPAMVLSGSLCLGEMTSMLGLPTISMATQVSSRTRWLF